MDRVLPAGTVVFLFTDIEGSTKRWERYPDAMKAAVERHDTILRHAITGNGGIVFRTEGDAFRAAFTTAPQALRAALDSQRVLTSEQWSEEIAPISVRMALHTGTVEVRDGDYVGAALNRIARLVSAAHGGQTLVSSTTEQLVRDNLPPGVTLSDLGEHRLKDLIRPERIFEVVAPGLPSGFPPLNTLDRQPNNLPLQPTTFIGREKELAAMQCLIESPEARLITLTGPGGSGKTRLALQSAADLAGRFPDGAFFVNLAATSDPDRVVSEVAEVVGVKESADRTLAESVTDYLEEKHMLLLLDNFEQVVAAAPFVAELLQVAPQLKVLITSREGLHLRGEKEFPVPPLALPKLDHEPFEGLSRNEAVRLFVARAGDARPDFRLTNENARAVAEICYRLDGLPLAIELAAARVKILAPQAILARLQSRLKLLTGGARDLPARQQTLRNAIEWSYDLLDEDEKQLFRRLAVFRGGRTLEAIEAICNEAGDLRVDVLDGVESLVGKSLLRQEETEEGQARFIMLETIHEYAREKLEDSGEGRRLSEQHAGYFLHLLEASEQDLEGADQAARLRQLGQDYDNIRAGLQWAIENDGEVALRFVGPLSVFWDLRSYYREGRELLSRVLSMPAAARPSIEKAKALRGAGNLADTQGDFVAARSYFKESAEIYRQMGDRAGMSGPLNGLGAVALHQGKLDEARSYFNESLAIRREASDQSAVSACLSNLGIVAFMQGDYGAARSYFEESLALDEALGNQDSIATSLLNLGDVALVEGRFEEARSAILKSKAMFEEVGDTWGVALTIAELGDIAHRSGDYVSAREQYIESQAMSRQLGSKSSLALASVKLGNNNREQSNYEEAAAAYRDALSLYSELEDKGGIADAVEGLASLAVLGGEIARAAKLWNAAELLRKEIGHSIAPFDESVRLKYRTRAQAQVDPTIWEKAWAEGSTLDLPQLVEYASGTSQQKIEPQASTDTTEQ